MTLGGLRVVRGSSVEDVERGWLGHHAYRPTPAGWEAALMRALCCPSDERPAIALLNVECVASDPDLPNPHKVVYRSATLVRVIYLTRPEVFERGVFARAFG